MSSGVTWSNLHYHSIPLAAVWRIDFRGTSGSGTSSEEAAAIVWAKDLDGWTRVVASGW